MAKKTLIALRVVFRPFPQPTPPGRGTPGIVFLVPPPHVRRPDTGLPRYFPDATPHDRGQISFPPPRPAGFFPPRAREKILPERGRHHLPSVWQDSPHPPSTGQRDDTPDQAEAFRHPAPNHQSDHEGTRPSNTNAPPNNPGSGRTAYDACSDRPSTTPTHNSDTASGKPSAPSSTAAHDCSSCSLPGGVKAPSISSPPVSSETGPVTT